MYSSSFLQGRGIVRKKLNNNTDVFTEQLMKVRNALNIFSAGNITQVGIGIELKMAAI